MKLALLLIVNITIMASEMPRPPAFLKKAPHDSLYRATQTGGWFGTRWGAETVMEEIPVLERHPKLKGVHPDIVKTVEEASRHVEVIVFSGVRSRAKQIQFVKEKKSKCDPRKGCIGRHLTGDAVDIVFKPKNGSLDWSWEQGVATIKYIRGIGDVLGIKCLRDGSSWGHGLDVSKTTFRDPYHLERKRNCE